MALRPMIAAPELSANFKGHTFPLYACLNLKGVRATVQDGKFMGQLLKPIPNLYLQGLAKPWMDRLDGILVVGAANDPDCFDVTQAALKSVGGAPDVRFYVFDYIPETASEVDEETGRMGYDYRLALVIKQYLENFDTPDNCVTLLSQSLVETPSVLIDMKTSAFKNGYDGLIVRHIDGPYKHGRCTEKEGYMLKINSWSIDEAEIIGYTQYMRNDNAPVTNGIGRTVRCSKLSNRALVPMLGSLRVRDIVTDAIFSIGAGFTREQREELWDERSWLKGRVVGYKHYPTGPKNKPRLPVFQGLRGDS